MRLLLQAVAGVAVAAAKRRLLLVHRRGDFVELFGLFGLADRRQLVLLDARLLLHLIERVGKTAVDCLVGLAKQRKLVGGS